jgi:acyl-CoA synthetase (AMP-forming)/AMP-acid ligase II
VLTGEVLAGTARRYPRRRAWTFEGSSWTWREADDRVNRLANALLASGLRAQDRVAFLGENSHRIAELYFALAKANLIAVPINSRSVAREIDYILKAVEARGLLVSQDLAPRLKGTDLSNMACVVGFSGEHGQPCDYEEMLAQATAAEPPADFPDTSIRAIKFTSGTTGQPKGVISTHHKYLLTTLNYLVHSPMMEDDRALMVLPMTAGGGIQMLTAYCYRSCPTVILSRFNSDAALDAIERERVTRLYVVPTMLAALTDAQARKRRDLSSMRLLEYAGGPAPVALVRRAAEVLRVPLSQNYASSESGGQMAFLAQQEHEQLLNASGARRPSESLPFGREAPGYRIRILDDQGREVPDGAVGEMVVKSDSLMSGYWNQAELTGEVLRDGWLYSGDLARREADGLLTIVDRKRDVIVTGGFNVYSAEIEGVLSEHPAVAEVAIIGQADEYWGEVIVACVVLNRQPPCDEAILRLFCEQNLSGHKRPKVFRFMNALPKTSTGKVRKVELRAKQLTGEPTIGAKKQG